MLISEEILSFMRDAEKRLRACIDWRQFDIVMSTEAYELLQLEADHRGISPPSFEKGYSGAIFGLKLKVDAKAKEAFVFVSDRMKLAPHNEKVGDTK